MHIKILGASVNAAVIAYHLAEIGHNVLWMPEDLALINKLEHRQMIFDDVELSAALRDLLSTRRITLTPELLGTADVCIFAFTNDQFAQFEQQQNYQVFKNYKLIINYSHAGLGKTNILREKIGNDHIVYIPDFIREGHLIESFITPNLIVGCESGSETKALVREVFRPIFPLASQFNFMSILAAEFTKLSISGFLATKISFMNDLSNAADVLGIDIEEVRTAMITDTRISKEHLYPGCGFGGNLTRDVFTLREVIQQTGATNGLLEKIWDINEYQKEIIFRKLWTHFDGNLKGRIIAFWGAAFKPNTASLVQAPIIKILEACWAQGVVTHVHDPRALPALRELYPNQPLLHIYEDQYEATQDAEALCLVTEWSQYRSPDYEALKKYMKEYTLIDGRNIYFPKYVGQQGFKYIGIGRKGQSNQ